MLNYLIEFRKENRVKDESEHEFYIETLRFFLIELGDRIKDFNTKDMKKAGADFIESDFLTSYKKVLNSLTDIGNEMIVDCLDKGEITTDFCQIFEYICFALKKWEEIGQLFEDTIEDIKSFFQTDSLLLIFYICLYDERTFEKFVSDEQILNITMKYFGKKFYNLAELYVLQAFDTNSLLALKLKALVHLDKSGKRLIKNRGIFNLARYWSDPLRQTFEENFSIEEFEEISEDKKPKITIICKENGN